MKIRWQMIIAFAMGLMLMSGNAWAKPAHAPIHHHHHQHHHVQHHRRHHRAHHRHTGVRHVVRHWRTHVTGAATTVRYVYPINGQGYYTSCAIAAQQSGLPGSIKDCIDEMARLNGYAPRRIPADAELQLRVIMTPSEEWIAAQAAEKFRTANRIIRTRDRQLKQVRHERNKALSDLHGTQWGLGIVIAVLAILIGLLGVALWLTFRDYFRAERALEDAQAEIAILRKESPPEPVGQLEDLESELAV